MTPADCTQNGIRVSGSVSQPLFAKANRTYQNFYVNFRYVRSSTFTAALEEAYRGQIMTGKFPACVLNIELDPANVDANVHPAKTEVRFTNDRAIFAAVNIAVRNGLLNIGHDTPRQSDCRVPESRAADCRVPEPPLALASEKTEYVAIRPDPAPLPEPVRIEYRYLSPESFAKPVIHEQATLEPAAICSGLPLRVVGELFATYIVAEQGGDLVLIDKHAADERLRFEELKSELKTHSQLLLEPVEVDADLESRTVLVENADVLEQIGVKVAEQEGALFVTALPTLIECSKVDKTMNRLAKSLMNSGVVDGAFIHDDIMHRVACRAAIKAGDKSVEDDLVQLAERTLANSSVDSSLQYCPHGRPIVVRLTKRELEKKFRRLL
jgi:DNA mismatch repair protein MutL